MTMRAGWTFGGKRFAETVGVNGRTTYHIDGKLTPKAEWFVAYRAAKAADAEQRRITEMEDYDRRNPDTIGAIQRHEGFPF